MTWRRFITAIVVFFVVAIPLARLSGHFRSDGTDAADLEVQALQREYLRKKAMVPHLDVYRKQLSEMDRMFGAMLAQLPDRFYDDGDVSAAAKARGLRVDVLAVSKGEWRQEYYAQTPARIVVTGRYHQVGAFLADVGRLRAGMRIEPFVIERSQQPGMVTLKGVLFANRYRNEEEVAAQRKAAKP